MIKPGRVKPNKMNTLFHRQKKFKKVNHKLHEKGKMSRDIL